MCWKYGSNTYVIGTLLILSINALQALSQALPRPAADMGSEAEFQPSWSANTYLFTQFPTRSEMLEQFTHISAERECASF